MVILATFDVASLSNSARSPTMAEQTALTQLQLTNPAPAIVDVQLLKCIAIPQSMTAPIAVSAIELLRFLLPFP